MENATLRRVDWRLTSIVTVGVIVVVLVGSVVTKFSLTEMVLLAPVAVAVLGATAGLVIFWVKVIRDSRAGRR